MKEYKIFAINPGSTSTKIALFHNEEVLFSKNIPHDAEKLKEFPEVNNQFDYRKDIILNVLAENNVDLKDVDVFVGMAGGLVSLTGGTYSINEIMFEHARNGHTVKHPAILGCQLAYSFSKKYNVPAYVVNPPDVDEFQDLARVTGFYGIYRESRLHALNQKEVGIRFAKGIGRKYEQLNLVICHIGGGVSITAHRQGLMVDSNDCINGDGPMAPTRSGSIPAKSLIEMCFSGKYTYKEMYEKVTKNGGLVSHLGTSDAREVNARILKGDKYAKLIYDAMIYQIGKAVGSCVAVLKGKVDGIILTGGIAHDQYLVASLTKMLNYAAPVTAMAGEFEMEALVTGVLRVLRGEENPKNYTGIPVWDGFTEMVKGVDTL